MTHSITHETRRESYEKAQDGLSRRHQAVLDVVMRHPEGVTPFEVADELGLPVYQVRPRMTELSGDKIEARGKRFQPKTKRNEAVYFFKAPYKFENGQGVLFQ